MGVMMAHFGGWAVLPPRALPLNHLESSGDLSFPNLLPPHALTQFVVHVGVDPTAKAIFLEQCSKNRGYRDADIRGFRPECGVCLPDGPEVIASEVSMKAVSRRAAVQGVEVAFSRDAEFPGGRGLEGGGAESVGWGSQAGFSPSSLRASPVPPKSPRQKPSDLCEGETRNTGDDRVQGVSSVALNK
ncbi:hypothetical protein MJG53_012573 [Ovis ammon polii x Ovis aries]|uniref:Uncharacterized protein n=1 Tax=Ovis ammon polii x Ovis aries TaxID=2918886 RepID=A0ACB9ULT2_9CETA|nr:hypothetical protein MJG53_012573 [Ovis ammon polii x Ovis aries]